MINSNGLSFIFISTGGIRDTDTSGTSHLKFDNQRQHITVALVSDFENMRQVYNALIAMVHNLADGLIVGDSEPTKIFEWDIRRPLSRDEVENNVKLICKITYRIIVSRE